MATIRGRRYISTWTPPPISKKSQFLALGPGEVDTGRPFPIGTFFDVTAYRQATRQLSEEQAVLIDSVQSIFKEATVPT
jgi:hypothetical protein